MNVHRLLEHIEDKWRWYHAGSDKILEKSLKVKYNFLYVFL